jgi:hypothetical protein
VKLGKIRQRNSRKNFQKSNEFVFLGLNFNLRERKIGERRGRSEQIANVSLSELIVHQPPSSILLCNHCVCAMPYLLSDGVADCAATTNFNQNWSIVQNFSRQRFHLHTKERQ